MTGMIRAFGADPRARTLFALILLDIVLGVASAIRRGQFDWSKVAEFYLTMVLPMGLGYAAVWFLTPLLVADLLGEYSKQLGGALVLLAWGALVTQLAIKILGHVGELWGKASE